MPKSESTGGGLIRFVSMCLHEVAAGCSCKPIEAGLGEGLHDAGTNAGLDGLQVTVTDLGFPRRRLCLCAVRGAERGRDGCAWKSMEA